MLIHVSEQPPLLVKQEPHDQAGNTRQDFLHEWQVYELVRNHSALSHLRLLLSEAIHFDPQHAILVFNYRQDYCDLEEFYRQPRACNPSDSNVRFPVSIAAALGVTLAEVHQATFDRQDYRRFLAARNRDEAGEEIEEIEADTEVEDAGIDRERLKDGDIEGESTEWVPDLNHDLEVLTPEIFGNVAADGLKFYELYQRYESLGLSIRELNTAYEPCCLIHNDLKLDNVLLHLDWENLLGGSDRVDLDFPGVAGANTESSIRLIDWEKWTWGDPASDVGTLIASYLKLWLKSLIVRSGIPLEMSLRLAAVPLEWIRPSIVALTQSYLKHFPEILQHSPNFLRRVMQFTGLALIESIQAKLHYHEPFGNIEICMLQVAKTLLCEPLQAIPTVFGLSATELLHLDRPWQSTPQPTTPLPGNPPASVQPPPVPPGEAEKPRTASITPVRTLTQAAMLHDLIHNIQIQANGGIHHPHYAPPVQPDGLTDRLQQLPAELQRNYVRAQLQNYLYDLYFSGEHFCGEPELTQFPGQTPPTPTLENNTLRGLNMQFYQQLHHSNKGAGYFDPDWQVLRQAQNGTFAVQKEGLTIYIEPQRHLREAVPSLEVGDRVEIRLPPHRLEAGFYVAVGNAGFVSDDAPTIELYFNITPTGAIVLMQHLTQALNAIGMPFLLKAIADMAEYGRYDAGILKIERDRYPQVHPVLQAIYTELAPKHLHSPVPLFTKVLAPGLGLAEEPEREFDPVDFGLHRCQLVANALLSVWGTEQDSPKIRLNTIREQFTQQRIDWQRPYLNPNAEDIYTPLVTS